MPEILLLCEYATLNGGERSMLATLNGVAEAGFAPVVAAPPQGPLADALRCRGVEVIALVARDAAGRRQPGFREELAQLLRRRRPALVHANSLSMGRLSGPVTAEAGVPSLAHLRDIIKLSHQAVADLNCQRRLLAVSRATRAFHVAGGLCPEKTHVLYNGVDLEPFRPRAKSGYLHRELGLAPQAQLAGTIGQIALRKGHDLLVQAAMVLFERLPDLHLVVVGQRF
jgi:glycosyltransferase involved in cell wall biosynthesis